MNIAAGSLDLLVLGSGPVYFQKTLKCQNKKVNYIMSCFDQVSFEVDNLRSGLINLSKYGFFILTKLIFLKKKTKLMTPEQVPPR